MSDTTRKFENLPFDRVRHWVLRSVVGSVIAAALVGVGAVIGGAFGDLAWRCIATIGLFVLFSLISWYDADVSARRAPWFGALSFVTSFYLFLAGIVKIWLPSTAESGWLGGDAFVNWLWLVFVARIGLLHIHVVINTKRRLHSSTMDFISDATLALVGMLTVLLSLPALVSGFEFPEIYWRAIGVIAILDALGTVLIPLSYALFAPKDELAVDAGDDRAWPAPRATVHEAAAERPRPQVADEPTGEVLRTLPSDSSSAFRPPAAAYARPAAEKLLAWPRYADGTPLPTGVDGGPDFTGVRGY